MNIEECKSLLGWVSLNKLYIDTHNECDYHNIHKAIETLLTAYEKEKGENVKLRLQDIPLIEGELKAYKDRVNELKAELEKEKEKNKELTERVLRLESDKFWDNVVSKNKIKQIIYPTPENPIPLEVQQSEMYKKLVKEVEE